MRHIHFLNLLYTYLALHCEMDRKECVFIKAYFSPLKHDFCFQKNLNKSLKQQERAHCTLTLQECPVLFEWSLRMLERDILQVCCVVHKLLNIPPFHPFSLMFFVVLENQEKDTMQCEILFERFEKEVFCKFIIFNYLSIHLVQITTFVL